MTSMETMSSERPATRRAWPVVAGIAALSILAVGIFIAFRDDGPEPCYQTTMNTPDAVPQPSQDAAAQWFLTLPGYGDEFVDDLDAYSRAPNADLPAGVDFSTGTEQLATFTVVPTSAGWIVTGVSLDCPLP